VAWYPDERFTDAVALGNALRDALYASPPDHGPEASLRGTLLLHGPEPSAVTPQPTDDHIAREAEARQAEAYAAVAERARKAAKHRAARQAGARQAADDRIAREAQARQAEAYAAVAHKARKAVRQEATHETETRQPADDRSAREGGARQTAVVKNVERPRADPLTTLEALQRGILKYRADLAQFSIGVISCLIFVIISILFANGLKKGDLSWKGWLVYTLGMGLFGFVSAISLYHGFRSRACARCDLVLDLHPLRFGSLSTATSAAMAGDIEALTDLAERAEPWSSSNIWLCRGCQEVGIIDLPGLQTVLRGKELERLGRKIQPAPP
jgi:hypothetical protein